MLQEDLSPLMNWADKINMVMNEDKFELMRYGPQEDIKENTSYQVNKEAIIPREQLRDLAVMMCCNGTFTHHITNIASKLTGWILRTFQTRDRTCMVTLWNALPL